MTIIHVLLAIFGLGVLVFIHELGHYFVALWMKMKVETFSIGMGSPIIKWKRGDVTWQLGWLPFGGFVKITGMELTKKGKGEYVDPYSIKGGFFTQSPLKRIAVVLAGPVANFILAIVLFASIWLMGGREKPFEEFTQVIGWIDPQSELYAKGLRPGDFLKSYDNKPYTTAKDLLYAAIFSGEHVLLTGMHYDWEKGQGKEFTYDITPYRASKGIEGLMTTGIEANARYLIYDQIGNSDVNTLTEDSPMAKSGIRLEDRLVWADGEILFSMQQLSYLLNKNYALLTIMRNNKIFLSRQPRVQIEDLSLTRSMRGDLEDWQYEGGIKNSFSKLFVLPYMITDQGFVESELPFIDQESQAAAFPLYQYSDLEAPLQKGDQILAVDGVSFTTPAKMLELLQEHKVHIIVQGNVPSATRELWKEEDALFEKEFEIEKINRIAATIGQKDGVREEGNVRLLKPVIPRSVLSFTTSSATKELIEKQIALKIEELSKIKEQPKRQKAMAAFIKEQNKRLLGIPLQDRIVTYNPPPLSLFGSIFTETWYTLKALLSGHLHPKWLSGPVGIVQVMHHGWQIGVKEALFWMAAISLNLGFLNLLPIPVLDGGYLCLSLWEMVTRRRVSPKIMERMIVPFMVLLLGLLVFLTFQDVIRLF